MRAFVALDLADDVRRRIAAMQAELQPGFPGLRWVAASGVHLTLRFLGETSPEQVERIGVALRQAAGACQRGAGRLAGLGLFPEHGAPRILWLGLSLPERFLELQASCERAACAAGFRPERRSFHPHLTLGRWRAPAPRPALPPVDLGLAELASVVLYESQLRPSGAVYRPLATFALP